VTVNGRTLATDNNGREFSFDVLPSEIISGADVYKSPQANINGASIGATIDVRTLRPLEQRKPFSFAGSVGSTWAELRDTNNPEASGVVSWRNEDRTLGVALSASYSETEGARRRVHDRRGPRAPLEHGLLLQSGGVPVAASGRASRRSATSRCRRTCRRSSSSATRR
jgi:hypothetical protein